jgi:hypothetical protein
MSRFDHIVEKQSHQFPKVNQSQSKPKMLKRGGMG